MPLQRVGSGQWSYLKLTVECCSFGGEITWSKIIYKECLSLIVLTLDFDAII